MQPNTQGQTSLINWLHKVGGEEKLLADSVRYDNQKTERLELLSREIGLPINQTDYVAGETFAARMPELIAKRGANTPLAFRIAPKETCPGAFDITKQYGLTIPAFAEFLTSSAFDLAKADIRITDYRGELAYSSVIIVSADGIVGEIVNGALYALTYAADPGEGKQVAQSFCAPRSELQIVGGFDGAEKKVAEILSYIHVSDGPKRAVLEAQGFVFADDYLCGYYEYVEGKAGSPAFTDMNNKIVATNLDVASTIAQLQAQTAVPKRGCRGLVASKSKMGSVQGIVRIVRDASVPFEKGNILVTEMTTVDLVPLMRIAGAVVTDKGGITSHAAIVARELGVLTVVGTQSATRILKDGDVVEVDADNGMVRILRQ